MSLEFAIFLKLLVRFLICLCKLIHWLFINPQLRKLFLRPFGPFTPARCTVSSIKNKFKKGNCMLVSDLIKMLHFSEKPCIVRNYCAITKGLQSITTKTCINTWEGVEPFGRRSPEAGAASGEGSEVLGRCEACGCLCGSGLALPPCLHPVLGGDTKSATKQWPK